MKRTCERCGKSFNVKPSAAKRGTGRYCSMTCRRPLASLPESERFWAQVKIGDPNECWEWQGLCQKPGSYGRFLIGEGSKYRYAHIMAWELANQACVLPGYVVRHAVCDNRPCCNPRHLKPGTQKDNMEDCRAHGRLAVGEKSGSRKHRERLPRGEKHAQRMRQVAARGDNHVCAKLKAWQIPYIKALREHNLTYRAIGQAYGVDEYPIRAVVQGIAWKHAQNGDENGSV